MASLAFFLGTAAAAAGVSVCAMFVSSLLLGATRFVRVAARRADLAFVAAVLPASLAIVGALAAAVPSIFAALGAEDHCLSHLHHAHLCPVHSADLHTRILAAGALALAFSLTVAIVSFARVARGSRFLHEALRVGSSTTEGGVRVVTLPGAPRLLHAAGALRPFVVASQTLLDALSPTSRVAVLAHEAAHVRRRDSLALWTISALSFATPPAFASWARRAFLTAADEAADEEAATSVGTFAVAEAIVEVARLRLRSPIDDTALAADGTAVEARVVRLLALSPRRHRPALAVIALAALALACAALVAAESVHHAAETVLFFFA
jgi:Zn-dependent protease with chaperone function